MFCLYPQIARYSSEINSKTGKRRVVLLGQVDNGSFKDGITVKNGKLFIADSDTFLLPCGQCLSCRLNRAKEWAIRCICEAKMHDHAMFVTLTYNDENIPVSENGHKTLVKKHLQDFLKRLRKAINVKIKYFACGEYGTKYSRPHYHLLIFGYQFTDLIVYNSGANLYRSSLLEKLWKFGFSTVGSVSYDSCLYVSRYIMKKQYGSNEVLYDDREKEFITMSLKTAIGREYFDKYAKDIKSLDRVIISDRISCRPPRYFDNMCDSVGELSDIKLSRIDKARKSVESYIDSDGAICLNSIVDDWRNKSLEELISIREKNKERFYETGSLKPLKNYKKFDKLC